MNTKDFTNPEEATAFIKLLQKDNTIDVAQTTSGLFRVMWVENKMYTALDGKDYTDEVWTKEDGTMIVCQDLNLEHAKNIIRMIIRNERRLAKAEQDIIDYVNTLSEDDADIIMEDSTSPVTHTLH
jgi:hypothetical protein